MHMYLRHDFDRAGDCCMVPSVVNLFLRRCELYFLSSHWTAETLPHIVPRTHSCPLCPLSRKGPQRAQIDIPFKNGSVTFVY